jgi:hypothetical protein
LISSSFVTPTFTFGTGLGSLPQCLFWHNSILLYMTKSRPQCHSQFLQITWYFDSKTDLFLSLCWEFCVLLHGTSHTYCYKSMMIARATMIKSYNRVILPHNNLHFIFQIKIFIKMARQHANIWSPELRVI